MPSIHIVNPEVCKSCGLRSCTICDVVERKTFATFKSERDTCPRKILTNGPDDRMLELGRIDSESRADAECIYCYICVDKCSQGNLSIEDYEFSTDADFASLRAADSQQANALANIIASSYLNSLFDFAANTTLNRSVSFDGVVYDKDGRAYFVEVDSNDDSLESFRRLLGDIAIHNANPAETPIEMGIMVLSNLPKAGSRDVYTLAEKVKAFPGTSNVKVFVTTFKLLRYYLLNIGKNAEDVPTLFFEIANEKPVEYTERLVKKKLLDYEYAAVQF